jgi:hypothetical protein
MLRGRQRLIIKRFYASRAAVGGSSTLSGEWNLAFCVYSVSRERLAGSGSSEWFKPSAHQCQAS